MRSIPNSGGVASDKGEESWIASHFRFVPPSGWAVLLLVGLHCFGAFAQVMDSAFLVTVERDWIVALSQGSLLDDSDVTSSEALSTLTVTLKQIDLGCKITAPAALGLVVPLLRHLRVICIVVGIVNLVALVVEFQCMRHIYTHVPELRKKCALRSDGESTREPPDTGGCQQIVKVTQYPCTFPRTLLRGDWDLPFSMRTHSPSEMVSSRRTWCIEK